MFKAIRFSRADLLTPDVAYRITRIRLAKLFGVLPSTIDAMAFTDAADALAYENALKLIEATR